VEGSVRARVAASAGLTALVAMTLAGCNFFTPQSTLVPYDPSDHRLDREMRTVAAMIRNGELGALLPQRARIAVV